jgi:hypothetical protein
MLPVSSELDEWSPKMSTRTDLVNQLQNLNFPEAIDQQQLSLAAKDAALLASKLNGQPEGMQELLGAALAGNMSRARDLITTLGLTEQDFQAAEGGFLWLVVIVVVLYATSAY